MSKINGLLARPKTAWEPRECFEPPIHIQRHLASCLRHAAANELDDSFSLGPIGMQILAQAKLRP